MKKLGLLFSILFVASSCDQASDTALQLMQLYRSEVDAYEAVVKLNSQDEIASYESYNSLRNWVTRSEQVAKSLMSAPESWPEEVKTRYAKYVEEVLAERSRRLQDLTITVPGFTRTSAPTQVERLKTAQAKISNTLSIISQDVEDSFATVNINLVFDDNNVSTRIECVKLVGSILRNFSDEDCLIRARNSCDENIDLSCVTSELERLSEKIRFQTCNSSFSGPGKQLISAMEACKY